MLLIFVWILQYVHWIFVNKFCFWCSIEFIFLWKILRKNERRFVFLQGFVDVFVSWFFDTEPIGVWKIQNVSGRTFYLRKGNRGDLIPFETNTVIEIVNGDCIYADEEKQKDNLSYDEIMKEDIKPVVFLQFNIR